MRRYDRRFRLLAISLAALAGFVDATGFLQLGGLFVSFMSGNSTRLAVESEKGAWTVAAVAATIVLLFVLGVIVGSIVRRLARRRPMTRVIALVALMLAIATLLTLLGHDRASVACCAIAMGAANVAFELDGEVSVGVTYVTGALVKVGQHVTNALFGGDRTAWAWQAALWLGLVLGAVLGSAAWRAFHLHALGFAAAFAVGIALAARWLERPGDASRLDRDPDVRR